MENIEDGRRPESVLGRRTRALREARGWTQDEVVRQMCAAGFSWRQSTVAKTESAGRPVRLDEATALAAIFGVTVDDLVRPELHPLTARVQLAAGAFAEAARELAARERERDSALWRRDEARERLEVLEDLAQATFSEPSREAWEVALARVMELFDHREQQAILRDMGITEDVWKAAMVDAANSEETGPRDRDITFEVAQRLPMPTKAEG